MIKRDLLNEKIKDIKRKNVIAFQLAEPGAMGDPGVVHLFYAGKKGLQVLSGDYVYGDLDIDLLVKQLKFKGALIRGLGSKPPVGWEWIYLGFGNHVLLKKELYDILREKYKGKHPGELYQNLEKEIEEICKADG